MALTLVTVEDGSPLSDGNAGCCSLGHLSFALLSFLPLICQLSEHLNLVQNYCPASMGVLMRDLVRAAQVHTMLPENTSDGREKILINQEEEKVRGKE